VQVSMGCYLKRPQLLACLIMLLIPAPAFQWAATSNALSYRKPFRVALRTWDGFQWAATSNALSTHFQEPLSISAGQSVSMGCYLKRPQLYAYEQIAESDDYRSFNGLLHQTPLAPAVLKEMGILGWFQWADTSYALSTSSMVEPVIIEDKFQWAATSNAPQLLLIRSAFSARCLWHFNRLLHQTPSATWEAYQHVTTLQPHDVSMSCHLKRP